MDFWGFSGCKFFRFLWFFLNLIKIVDKKFHFPSLLHKENFGEKHLKYENRGPKFIRVGNPSLFSTILAKLTSMKTVILWIFLAIPESIFSQKTSRQFLIHPFIYLQTKFFIFPHISLFPFHYVLRERKIFLCWESSKLAWLWMTKAEGKIII